MAILRTQIAQAFLIVGMIALWTGVFVKPVRAIEQTLSVQIKPGGGEGAGFDVVLWGDTSHLTVTLTTPSSSIIIIQPTTLRCSGDFIWNWTSIADTSETVEALGIGRDDDHAIGFDGRYATTTTGGGGGGSNKFDVAVADVRIAGHKTEQTDDDALNIPASDDPNSPLDAGTMNVTVTLQASSDAPDPAGTLTLSWTDYAGIAYLYHDGIQINNGDTIDVPRGGLSNEPIEIWTTQAFTDSATIQATFNWDSSFVAQNATAKSATDYVQVASSLYALDVLDAQGFQPTAPYGVPGLGVDPAGAPIPGSWDRPGVFADGVSVLVIRPRPKNGLVPLNVTYSIQALPNVRGFPQTREYVGAFSEVGNTAPSYNLPNLPAPDADAGVPTFTSPTARVYYRPPNNFLFGRQGAQQLRIEGKDSNNIIIARRDICLIRPTIFVNHGVLSAPRYFKAMGDAIAGRGNGGGRGIRVCYLDFEDINTAGYDNVTSRLCTNAAARVRDNIQRELQGNRAVGIAATRVDCVGHSMGGVIVKWYASNLVVPDAIHIDPTRRNGFPDISWNKVNQNYFCFRADNFGKGDIRRLVTFGSPFRGSPIAEQISNTLGRAGFLINLGQILTLVPADINAGDDLGTDSKATAILSNEHPAVTWLPIVGLGGPNLGEIALFNDNLFVYTLAKALGLTPGQIAPLGLLADNSDFVVSQWSQIDRPQNGPQPAKVGIVNNVTHLMEAKSGLNVPAAPPTTVGNYIVAALDLYYDDHNAQNYEAGYNDFNPSF